jgi:xanthine dehydrogenase molybdenum-binding subunit
MKTGKPVKLEYTGGEDFVATETRQPFIQFGKMGVKREGTITALETRIVADAGAYFSHSGNTTAVDLCLFKSLYRCPNISCEAKIVYTNTPTAGGLRGYGTPQAMFVLEQLADMAAEKIGIDPVEFRLKNHKRTGDPSWAPSVPIESCALDECLRVGARAFGWKKKKPKTGGKRKRGVGVAAMVYISTAYPMDADQGNASIHFNGDGSANLVVSACDFGQGILGALTQIAAEELGLRAQDIHVVTGDTDVTMFDVGQYASRSCYILGNAVLRAARQAKQKLIEQAAVKLHESAENLIVRDRRVFVGAEPDRGISVAEVALDALYNPENQESIRGYSNWKPTGNPNPFQAVFAEVEIDVETGELKVLRVVLVHDIGRAINPTTVEGQLEGGLVQSIGYALTEDFAINPMDGSLESNTLTNYKIPTSLDVPEIDVILVEKPTPTGPFGAKSVGESASMAIAPAIHNAVYDAVGVRYTDMPLSAERILEGLRTKSE